MVATALAAVLAIDYGQEYTKAALLSPGINFEIVLTQDSKRKQPSAIGFKGKADSKFGLERVYGSPAVLMEPRFPSDVVLYHKRLLGGRPKLDNPNYKEYTQMRPACMAVPSNSSRSAIAFQVKDSEWSAEELLAMQISDIKSRADDMLKTQSKSNTDTVKDVVMTVPPHFTHSSVSPLLMPSISPASSSLLSSLMEPPPPSTTCPPENSPTKRSTTWSTTWVLAPPPPPSSPSRTLTEPPSSTLRVWDTTRLSPAKT